MATVDSLDEEQHLAFRAEIAGFVALTGGGWLPEQRAEFIEQAAADLAGIPVRLLAPAIREARRRIWSPARFVSWVYEHVADDVAKLRAERETLNRLAAIADQLEPNPV